MAKAAEAVEATIAGEGKLDAHKLRADFPSSEQRFHGKPLAYLDSAVSAQKPRQVLDAQREFYETSYTNSTAASTSPSGRQNASSARAKEGARLHQRGLHARDRHHAQRDRGAEPRRLRLGTRQPGPGDLVAATELEHHSNFRALAADREAYRRELPLDSRRRSWRKGLGWDFLAFSSHKLCGPTGVGGRRRRRRSRRSRSSDRPSSRGRLPAEGLGHVSPRGGRPSRVDGEP